MVFCWYGFPFVRRKQWLICSIPSMLRTNKLRSMVKGSVAECFWENFSNLSINHKA